MYQIRMVRRNRYWNLGEKLASVDDCRRAVSENRSHIRFWAFKFGAIELVAVDDEGNKTQLVPSVAVDRLGNTVDAYGNKIEL